MGRMKTAAVFLILMLGVAPGVWAQMMQRVEPGDVRVFNITARRNQFSPFVIIVKPGDRVKLVVTAVDRDYGFELPAYHIHRKLKKGVPVTIELTAAAPGKFRFHSPNLGRKFLHREMKGTFVVSGKAPESAPAPPSASQ